VDSPISVTATDTDNGLPHARVDAPPPTEVAGRYLVLDKLGEGGMGVVHRAYDPALRREVALKVVRVARSQTARERLLREAQALAQVTHHNVVTIYDVGSVGSDVFLAMELIRGDTLAGWLRTRRTPAEIIATFVAAGRGLAAAHAAGLVHRDFKPANVMVGENGHVRVLDFGLARLAGEAAAAESPSPVDSPICSPTRSRATVQCSARLATCRPSSARARLRMRAPISTRSASHSKKRSTVLQSAAAYEQRSRAALPKSPNSDSRRWTSCSPSSRRAGASICGSPRRARSRSRSPAACSCARRRRPQIRRAARSRCRFNTMWTPLARERIHAAFIATNVPIAEATWSRIAPIVDRWGNSWIDTRREACAATQVRGEQSPALMDLRMSCLDDRKRELGALLEVFAHADADVVPASLKAISQLEPIERCTDTAALANVAAPKSAIAAAVDQQKVEVDAISAAVRSMQVPGTVERAQKALSAATALGYLPLEARARFELGLALNNDGKYADAFASLEAAALAADRAGDDRLRARSWLEALYIAGSPLRKGDDAMRARAHAAAAIDRIRDPGVMPLRLHLYTAGMYWTLGKPNEGLAEIDAALALVTQATPKVDHANVLNQRGLLLQDLERRQEAIDTYAEARKLFEAEYGPDHPRIAMVLSNASNSLSMLVVPDDKADWKYAESERMQREALAIGERSFGPDHPQVATYLNNIVNVMLRTERFADALPFARRAVAIRERKLPPDHPLTVRAVINLAMIITGAGKPEEAEPLYLRGLAMQSRSVPALHYDVAYARMQHGRNLLELGRGADARAELQLSYDTFSKVQAKDSPIRRLRARMACPRRCRGR
jgi:tetratricopeptide (TPR) repeat protein/predicted Ser/Thr protein kinase